jgi:uncharacterized membrane protein
MKIEKTEATNIPFLTTPVAMVIGSVIISVAILISGGVIQIKGVSGGSATAGQLAQASSAPTQQVAAPQPKTGSSSTETCLGLVSSMGCEAATC